MHVAFCIIFVLIMREDEPLDILELENINDNNYAVMGADEKRDIIAQLLFN